nr:phage antirepressor KilAC domain-containing protein [Methylobacterium sp. SD274]
MSSDTNFPVVSEANIGAERVQTVDARELHRFLGIGAAFKDWISRRIAEYAFSEGADFCSFLSESGGRPAKEYAISLDMAKQLGMVERNDQGRRVRQYFIDCERRLKGGATLDPIAVLSDPAAMRGLLLGYTERVIALESRVAEMTPQVEALDRIADTHGTLCRSTAAKMLNVPPQTLTRWMRTNGWTFRRPGCKDDIAYQSKVNDGLLEHKITTGPRPDGTEWSSTQVRVTAKGLTSLAKAFPPAACAA